MCDSLLPANFPDTRVREPINQPESTDRACLLCCAVTSLLYSYYSTLRLLLLLSSFAACVCSVSCHWEVACLSLCASIYPTLPNPLSASDIRINHGVWSLAVIASLNPPRTDNPHSEPRGFSNLLNPSKPSGDVQKHYVHGHAVSVYEENGRLYHAWKRGTYPYPMDEVCRVVIMPTSSDEAYNPPERAKPIRHAVSPYPRHHPEPHWGLSRR